MRVLISMSIGIVGLAGTMLLKRLPPIYGITVFIVFFGLLIIYKIGKRKEFERDRENYRKRALENIAKFKKRREESANLDRGSDTPPA